jgi:hypothetical protein
MFHFFYSNADPDPGIVMSLKSRIFKFFKIFKISFIYTSKKRSNFKRIRVKSYKTCGYKSIFDKSEDQGTLGSKNISI